MMVNLNPYVAPMNIFHCDVGEGIVEIQQVLCNPQEVASFSPGVNPQRRVHPTSWNESILEDVHDSLWYFPPQLDEYLDSSP
jgi:hypothetical protein